MSTLTCSQEGWLGSAVSLVLCIVSWCSLEEERVTHCAAGFRNRLLVLALVLVLVQM